MKKAFVAGIDMTTFAKTPQIKIEILGAQAVKGAAKDAGIEIRDIEEVYCGNVMVAVGPGQKVMTEIGHIGIPVTNLENACAAGSNAFREAYLAVASGRRDICLALGVENLSSVFGGALQDESDLEGAQGLTFPALYALRARRYTWEHGLKPEHLAKIAIKNRKNAYHNDKSAHGEIVDMETVLNSPMIVDPLRLYDCNPVSDGAAAAVIVSEKTAKQLGNRCIEIVASSMASGKLEHGFIDMTYEEMTHRSAHDCYEQAASGPEDIDLAEVHDCFTIAEILRVESMGFCERGGMIKWIEEGVTEINGKKPINPSGGLLGKGHPLGATGIAQIYEICRQLRGEAGQRQIENARTGIAMCRGGATTGIEGNACVMHILRRT
jgi:benzoylsuccinyl-CoA thiolase BbsB subunit